MTIVWLNLIQYQAPLLQYLLGSDGIDLEVFFLSDFLLYEQYEQAFNQPLRAIVLETAAA